MEQQKLEIDSLCQKVRDLDPSFICASWSPESGGEMIVSLNQLSDAFAKKAAQIKEHVRMLTVEELNELDGFDHCDESQRLS